MKAALDQFEVNLGRALALSATADSLGAMTTVAIDLTDIYRAALVLGVSALDYFVHEFVRLGMLEINRGGRTATDAYLMFKVPLAAAQAGIANSPQDAWLDQAIREAHSWPSFQHPDKVADAIRLVSGIRLWDSVALELGSEAKQVRARLVTVVDRRNKIAHEADMDPTNPGSQWPIDGILVKDALHFLGSLVRAIYNVTV
jgi:hypothetical protein